ncbi:hypothetical protein P4050_00615, partial [Pseudomonas aeruginosa]|nr:hypothetical protein [Pseudomonas aeruginosa]
MYITVPSALRRARIVAIVTPGPGGKGVRRVVIFTTSPPNMPENPEKRTDKAHTKDLMNQALDASNDAPYTVPPF